MRSRSRATLIVTILIVAAAFVAAGGHIRSADALAQPRASVTIGEAGPPLLEPVAEHGVAGGVRP
jgi:hypothetical protein